MSQPPIDRDDSLRRLSEDGYCIEVRGTFLILHGIPYVRENREVAWGKLVSTLNWITPEKLGPPTDHVAHFVGDQPCHKDGRPIQQIVHQQGRNALDKDLVVDRSFSNKPPEGYRDYYHKMTTYADIICGPAFSLDPKNTPKRFLSAPSNVAESVFNYHDTASSRAGIVALTRRFENLRIAIIGLGGTGAYVLDQVCKTPVKTIELFDGDRFYTHNAFRAPGAPSISELEAIPYKVEYFANMYSRMHRGINPHPYHLNEDHESDINGVDFAFVCIDGGASKRFILEALERRRIAYIDCGIGVEDVEGSLTGQVRVTASTENFRSHVWDQKAISFAEEVEINEYSRNIQVADLNTLNAALAVIKWKKLLGFYVDLEREMHAIYPIDGNVIINAYQRED